MTTLQSKKFVQAKYIADKYSISIRTVYRDLKALGEIGVPIAFEENKGYFILQGFFLPPISLTREEANAIILVSSLSERFTDTTTKNHLDDALNKIKALLRSSDKDKANLIQSRIKIYTSPTQGTHPDFLTEIQIAIINQLVLKIQYTNNNNEDSQREIEPIGLTFYSDQWHLIAWCWKRNEYRDFKVNNIRRLHNNGEEFRKKNHYDINDYIKSLT